MPKKLLNIQRSRSYRTYTEYGMKNLRKANEYNIALNTSISYLSYIYYPKDNGEQIYHKLQVAN